MTTKIKASLYNKSNIKRVVNFTFSLFGLILTSPIFALITLLLKIYNNGPIFFTQKRIGKNGKEFTLIKFRTMRIGAEEERGNKSLEKLNIADGPVFKIPNDPRYTKFGGYLVKSGLDELPQLINVLRGEMNLVGPRPLPVYEAVKLTRSQKVREMVLPGITSSWVINGAHRLMFKEWMELDKKYVKGATLTTDIYILFMTAQIMLSIGKRKLIKMLFPKRTYQDKNSY